jgi:hypothetical protein
MRNEFEDAIGFAVSEVFRISKLDPKELMKGKQRLEWMASLPSPSGMGEVLCGYEAYKRLRIACDVAAARNGHAGRLDSEDVFKALKPIITQRFLKEGRNPDQRECDKAFSAAVREAAKNMVQLTYYIPVHLGPVRSPEAVSIGPVKFSLMAAYLENLAEQESVYLNDGEGDTELKQRLLDDTKEYYEEFGWIAEVCVEKSSPSLSKNTANRRIQYALDCLHLYLGSEHSDSMRVSGPRYFTDRRAEIVEDTNGKIDVSISVDWHSNHLPDNWWSWINAEGADEFNRLFGEAIKHGTDLSNPTPLALRILDALLWFGQAVRDEFQASRIVKYVTAIERILVTEGSNENLVDTLSKRGAALTFDLEVGSLAEQEKKFKMVYDLRSELVHGSRSPSDDKMGAGEYEAEDLARQVLYRAVQYFGTEGVARPDYSDRKLKESFTELLEWARNASEDLSGTQPSESGT